MRRRPCTLFCALGGVFLAACAGTPSGHWAKQGADEAAVSAAVSECRAQADAAFATDRGIDTDILASRGRDWQQAGTLANQRERMREQTATRAGAILDACMRAKGFVREG